MNSSYVWIENKERSPRYYFTYYSQFGDRNGAAEAEVVILAIIFIMAVGANAGIAGCIIRYKELWTPTNLCLANLAAADFLFALGAPAIAYTRLTQSWRLGEVACRLLPYSQFVCGFVLLWTLTFISMDRYRCLAVVPYRSVLTRPRVLVISLITWLIAASLFLPVAFWFKPMQSITGGFTICTLVFPQSNVVDVSVCFTIPIVIVACILPVVLLVYHYQRIFQRILDTRSRWAVPCVVQGTDIETGRRDSELSVMGALIPWSGRKSSASSASGHQGRNNSFSQHEEIRLHKHLRVVRMLLINVLAVLVMWLPIAIVVMLIYLDGRRSVEDKGFFLRSHHLVWAIVVAQMNTVVNPFLYGVFSENFNKICFARLHLRKLDNQVEIRERAGSGSRKSTKSLDALQDRLGGYPRTSSSLKNSFLKKSSGCSIDSIVEIPASEKL